MTEEAWAARGCCRGSRVVGDSHCFIGQGDDSTGDRGAAAMRRRVSGAGPRRDAHEDRRGAAQDAAKGEGCRARQRQPARPRSVRRHGTGHHAAAARHRAARPGRRRRRRRQPEQRASARVLARRHRRPRRTPSSAARAARRSTAPTTGTSRSRALRPGAGGVDTATGRDEERPAAADPGGHPRPAVREPGRTGLPQRADHELDDDGDRLGQRLRGRPRGGARPRRRCRREPRHDRRGRQLPGRGRHVEGRPTSRRHGGAIAQVAQLEQHLEVLPRRGPRGHEHLVGHRARRHAGADPRGRVRERRRRTR